MLNVTTEFDFELGDLVNNGTIPSTSPVAELRAASRSSRKRRSTTRSGRSWTPACSPSRPTTSGSTSPTVLTLTRNYNLSPDEVGTLVAAGITEAGNLSVFRFYVNDFATRTHGIDLVSTWTPLALGGRITFSGVFNYTDTALTEFNAEHIDQDRVAALTVGLPKTRWNAGVTYNADQWSLMTRVHFYGSYWDREDARNALGKHPVVPVPVVRRETARRSRGPASRSATMGFRCRSAPQNVLNTYPDENPHAVGGVGNRYGQFGPFGFNGGYYYTRINYGWGTQ